MVPGFYSLNCTQTTIQVSARTHDMVDVSLTLSLYQGHYARVLVDIDLKSPLPEIILVKRQDEESGIDMSFCRNNIIRESAVILYGLLYV